MPILNYNIKSSKEGLPLSPSELENLFFFGIGIKDKDGNGMSNDSVSTYIKGATEMIEGLLNAKIVKQVVEEKQSWQMNDFKSWGYIPTSYPVNCIGSLTGFLGDIEQVKYPTNWLSNRTSSDGHGYWKNMYLVPTSAATTQNTVIYSGVAPHVGWYGQSNIPYYWTVRYTTSFDFMPNDILMAIGKLASIGIFHQLGDIILGAGIASQSLGLDGLSQSIATTSSATNAGYGARISGYLADLKLDIPRLRAKYNGILLTSC